MLHDNEAGRGHGMSEQNLKDEQGTMKADVDLRDELGRAYKSIADLKDALKNAYDDLELRYNEVKRLNLELKRVKREHSECMDRLSSDLQGSVNRLGMTLDSFKVQSSVAMSAADSAEAPEEK